VEVGGSWSEASPRKKSEILSEKSLKQKGLGGMGKMVEHLRP
jgi:hypothetical protein